MLVGLLLIGLAAVSWGTTGATMTLLARDASAGPLLVGWARLAVAAPCLLLAAWISQRRAALLVPPTPPPPGAPPPPPPRPPPRPRRVPRPRRRHGRLPGLLLPRRHADGRDGRSAARDLLGPPHDRAARGGASPGATHAGRSPVARHGRHRRSEEHT